MTYFDAVREASANDHRRVHKAALDVRIQATRDSLASMRNERATDVAGTSLVGHSIVKVGYPVGIIGNTWIISVR